MLDSSISNDEISTSGHAYIYDIVRKDRNLEVSRGTLHIRYEIDYKIGNDLMNETIMIEICTSKAK